MGLDMFLFKAPNKFKASDFGDGGVAQNELVEIVYWRKANQVFRWLEENLASVPNHDVQNCEYYEVTEEEYNNLIKTCETALVKKTVPKGLETKEGFFFGSTEYDEWYWKEIENTVKDMTAQQSEIDWKNDKVWYYAWW